MHPWPTQQYDELELLFTQGTAVRISVLDDGQLVLEALNTDDDPF